MIRYFETISPLDADLVKRFLSENGDRRLLSSSVSALLNNLKMREGRGIWVHAWEYDLSLLVGLSACLVGAYVQHSITVVHKDYRNQGIGAEVLRLKLLRLSDEGLTLNSAVASDNPSSLRICEKTELIRVGERQAERRSGVFTQVLFTNDQEVANTALEAADIAEHQGQYDLCDPKEVK